MIDIPRQWTCSGNTGFPKLPSEIGSRLAVKVNDREFHAVCAVDQDAGWIEVIAFDRREGEAVYMLHNNDVVRVKLRGNVEQSLR
jgi:hypothetical protein